MLLVDEFEEETALLRDDMRQSGQEAILLRIHDPKTLAAALDEPGWDVVVADYSLPHLWAARVLALLKEKGIDRPVIVLSALPGEDMAVAAMKAGARDYILKTDRSRLATAIQGALREPAESKAPSEPDGPSLPSDTPFRDALEGLPVLAVMLDVNGAVTFCNRHLLELLGCHLEDVLGQRWFQLFVPRDERDRVEGSFFEKITMGVIAPKDESDIVTMSGTRVPVSWYNTVLRDPAGRVVGTASVGCVVTDGRRAEEGPIVRTDMASDTTPVRALFD